MPQRELLRVFWPRGPWPRRFLVERKKRKKPEKSEKSRKKVKKALFIFET